MKIKIFVEDGGSVPLKAHDTDAGYDFFAPKDFNIKPYESKDVGTKVHMLIPAGYTGFVKTKSGHDRRGLHYEGVVDAGYTGEIRINIHNSKGEYVYFSKGDKIGQLVILANPMTELEEVDSVESLGETERGAGGFGSTGA